MKSSTFSRRQLLRQTMVAPAALSLAHAAEKDTFPLVRNGRSAYSIAISPEASPSERRAASELQKFIEEISGARLPIMSDARPKGKHLVLVGQSPALDKLKLNIDFDSLGPEGFCLKTAGKHLVIAGGKERGTMYGVSAFLEKLGCRWFTRDLSRIPHTPTIQVAPLDETQRPAFEYREPFFFESFDRDWAARNRVNGAHADLDASTGGKIAYYPFVHTFAELIPPKQYFRNHPEYFALVDGARRDVRAQLCLTNPDVLRLGIQSVLRWIGEHPEATIYSVSQNDCTGWCECSNCRQVEEEEGGAHSGPLLRYVNAVAAAIEEKHPDKLIDTLAYWYTEDPPAKVRPRKNVRIRLCPIGVCDAHPFEQCRYDAYFMKHLRAWSKITNQLYIWHYNTNFANYLLPFPDFDELTADIPMYQRHGVVGVFLEGEGGASPASASENARLRSYVLAKLLWDPKTDVGPLIDEFHAAYYGKAAAPMRKYFDLQHRQVRVPPNGEGHHAWIFDRADAPYLNDRFVAEAVKLFQQAESAADSKTALENVRRARVSIDYLQLVRAKVFSVQGDWYQPSDLNGLKEKWSAFLQNLHTFDIGTLREHGPLAGDEEAFRTWMKPYRVITLENEFLRVSAAPELDARIVSLIDKRSGKELLLHPDPGAEQYPDLNGLTLTVHSDYVSAPAWKVDWAAAGNTSTEAKFTGKTENGLELERTLRLEAGALRTTAVLKNTGLVPVAALLQSQVDTAPGNLDDIVVSYKNQSAPVEKALIQPDTEPSGQETYAGAKRPAGEWRLQTRSGATILVNRFPEDQSARATVSWSAKSANRASLSIVSARTVLMPKETLRLDSDYGVA